MQIQGVHTQAAVVGETCGGRVAFADARNANVVCFARFKLWRDKVREGGVNRVVNRLITVLEAPFVVVNLLAKLVDDVEIVIRIAHDNRFAKGQLKNLAVLVEQKNLAGGIEKFDLNVQVRIVIGRGVVQSCKRGVFRVAVPTCRPVEVRVDETGIGAVAGNVDNVGSAVGNEGEDVVVRALLNIANDVVRARDVAGRINVNADVVVGQRSRVFDRVSDRVFTKTYRGRDNRDIVLQLRRADVFALAPLGNVGTVTRAHDRRPGVGAAVFAVVVIGVLITVVTQTKGVTDLVRGRFCNVLGAQAEGERIDVIVRLTRAVRSDSGDAALAGIVAANDATDTARRRRPNGFACRYVDVKRSIVFRNATPDLLDHTQLDRAEAVNVVHIQLRMFVSIPASAVKAAEIQVNDVVRVARHTLERQHGVPVNRDSGKIGRVLLQPGEADDSGRVGYILRIVRTVEAKAFREVYGALNGSVVVKIGVRRVNQRKI